MSETLVTPHPVSTPALGERLLRQCSHLPALRLAVAHPCNIESLQAVVEARDKGLAVPLLVGPVRRIRELAEQAQIRLDGIEIVATEHSHASAAAAVAQVRSGRCDALMKGSLHTDEFLHAVLERTSGLRTDRRLSHVFVLELANYSRPLLITDAAINIYPNLIDKRDIVQNAIELAQCIGIAEPRVAILSASETVNPAVHSTIDAAALCKMAQRGQIRGGLLDGPLAFDTATSMEAVRQKVLTSEVAGVADILVAPDLEAGNILVKQLIFLAGAEAAGIVLGARVPIVLTSRADNAHNRLSSIALGVLVAHAERAGRKA